MDSSTQTLVTEQIRAEVGKTSLAAVARRLGVNRHSLGAFMCGCARPGTVALVLQQFAAGAP